MRPVSTDSTEPHAEADKATSNGSAVEQPNGNGTGPSADRPTEASTQQLDPLAAASGSPTSRGALRRRLDKLRRELDRQRAELGTLVLDAKRRSPTSRPEVVTKRATAVAELEAEVAELTRAVEGDAVRRELKVGIAGTCGDCGRLLASEDRFCASCGRPVKDGRARPAEAAGEAAPADDGSTGDTKETDAVGAEKTGATKEYDAISAAAAAGDAKPEPKA